MQKINVNSSACFASAGGLSILNISPSTMDEADVKRKAERDFRATNDPIEKIRFKCLMRGASGIKDFARIFRIADVDENNSLSKEELLRITQVYQLKLSEAEVNAAFEKIDKDGSGSISFDEFLLALRPPLNKNRLALIERAFAKLDKSGDGVVTVEDLNGVYDCTKHPKFVSGEWTKEKVFTEFLKNFEIGGHVDGKVTKEEFTNYYAGISSAIDTDVYFDLMMRNAWKL
uniref:Calcyphosin-like protein n=1 Tax=Panagrellus redivivus TaxID=6233 RepID=A0A7E4VC52_PANRE